MAEKNWADRALPAGALISIAFLIIFVVGALVAQTYEGDNSILGYSVPTYPYRPYVGVLALGTIVSVGGLIYSITVSSKGSRPQEMPVHQVNIQKGQGVSQIICGTCGTANDIDAVYCKKCGRQLR